MKTQIMQVHFAFKKAVPNQQRILYISRLFTGLAHSLDSATWLPSGAPTIYRIMEALPAHFAVKFVVAESSSRNLMRRDTVIYPSGFSEPITCLSGANLYFRKVLSSRVAEKFNRLSHVAKLTKLVITWRPDLIYVDRYNVVLAAYFSLILRKKVLLRIMGIYPSMWDLLASNKISHFVQRLMYRMPFRFVLCTMDGTNGGRWMNNALLDNVPRQIWLNGVDKDLIDQKISMRSCISTNTIKILYVGRLEEYKGCLEFLDAIIECNNILDKLNNKFSIKAVMIGDGSMFDFLNERVTSTAYDIRIYKRIPAAKVLDFQLDSDIYVSLNYLGNLSNANLEAAATGSCMIIMKSRPNEGVDADTDDFFPIGSVARISNQDIRGELVKELIRLIQDPAQIRIMGERVREVADSKLLDWEQRIKKEIDLIRHILNQD